MTHKNMIMFLIASVLGLALSACGIPRGTAVIGDSYLNTPTEVVALPPASLSTSRNVKKNLPLGLSLKITTRFASLGNLQQYPLQAALVDTLNGVEDPVEPEKLLFGLEGKCDGVTISNNILTVQYTTLPQNCILSVEHIYYIEKDAYVLPF